MQSMVFVQTLEPDVNESDVPDAITPLAGDGVTGAGVGVGAGLLAGGFVRGGVDFGRDGFDAGGLTGTSFSCGCVAESTTTVTSRAESAESAVAVSASRPQAAKMANTATGRTARK